MKGFLRRFLRSPGFFTVVVLTLAVGIGANTAIFSVVRGILLRPLPYAEPERLVGIGNVFKEHPDAYDVLSVLEYLDVQQMTERLEAMTVYSPATGNLSGSGPAERVSIAAVAPGFFEVLGIRPQLGRGFSRDEEAPGRDHVVVLTHALWQNRFGGDPEIVGKDIIVDNESYGVVGVLPRGFVFHEDFALYMPLGFPPSQREEKARDQHWLNVIGRMKPGAEVGALNAELALIGARLRAAHPTVYTEESGWTPKARPLLDNLVADVRPSLWLLAVAVGLVLLIVCGNVASLLLAEASTRQRELSVRAALGASRRRLLGQLLGENLVLSALGAALGILLAIWGTDALLALAPEELPRLDDIRVDGAVLLFSVLISAVTGVIFGLIPAWGASRVDLAEALHAGGRTASAGKRPRRVRRALVVAETALALILVAGAALVTRSFARVMSVDPGFQPEGVLSLTVSRPTPSGGMTAQDVARIHAWFAEAEARLAALPGVTSAASINLLPYGGRYGNRLLDVEGHTVVAGAERPSAQFRVVTPGYHETMRIPLVDGRLIGRQDAADGLAVAVVSERFVRETWPEGNAIGKRIRTYSPQGPWLTVVGVVGDIHERGLEAEKRATVYAAASQGLGAQATRSFVLRSDASMAHLVSAVRADLQRFDPDQPIHDVQPMSGRLAESVEQRRFVLVLFELFAVLALALSALGLYGVLAHAVGERQREIGVRVALGASAANVLGLVAREGALLIAAGVALGLAGGLAAARVLKSLLFDLSPTDPLSLLAALGLLLVASALAMWLPARRALRVHPTEALRDE